MSAANDWPFDRWLKIAVHVLRISPSEFWAMSLTEWHMLTAREAQTLRRESLTELQTQFPDEKDL